MLYSWACACILLVSISKQKRYYLHTADKMSFSVTISHQYHVTSNLHSHMSQQSTFGAELRSVL